MYDLLLVCHSKYSCNRIIDDSDVCAQQNPAKRKYQIHLKSHSGPIYVLLVNKDSDGSSPVVVQVPPPKEEMDVDVTEPAAENKPNGSRKVSQAVL